MLKVHKTRVCPWHHCYTLQHYQKHHHYYLHHQRPFYYIFIQLPCHVLTAVSHIIIDMSKDGWPNCFPNGICSKTQYQNLHAVIAIPTPSQSVSLLLRNWNYQFPISVSEWNWGRSFLPFIVFLLCWNISHGHSTENESCRGVKWWCVSKYSKLNCIGKLCRTLN